MVIHVGNKTIEVNSSRLDSIIENQSKIMMDNSKKLDGIQDVMYSLVAWGILSKSIMDAMLEKYTADSIIKILTKEVTE